MPRALVLVLLSLATLPSFAGVKLVASAYPLAMIASAVAPADAEVKHIVPTAVPAGFYRPTPDDLRQLAAADVVVWAGPESEPYLADALATPAPGQRVITLSKLPGVVVRDRHRDPGESRGYGRDPNLWLSTRNAAVLAVALGAYLGNPLAAEHFDAEMKRFRSRQSKRFAPVANVPLYSTHDGFGYLFDEIGLANVTAVLAGPGDTASATRVADLAARARQDRVVCMIGDAGFESTLGTMIFPDGHANLVTVDPQLGGLNLSRSSYTLSMTYLAETLYNCLVTR